MQLDPRRLAQSAIEILKLCVSLLALVMVLASLFEAFDFAVPLVRAPGPAEIAYLAVAVLCVLWR